MRTVTKTLVVLSLMLICPGLSTPAAGQSPETKEENATSSGSDIKAGFGRVSTTRHTLDSDGRELAYTAKAGELVLTVEDKDKELTGRFFFIAYHQEGADRARRPVSFAFNGGPGASSVWLHLGGLGPQIIELNEDGTPLPPPAGLVPNPLTWLAFTDLVFVDPVGTGYSRSLSEKEDRSFWGVEQDVASVAKFIRLYLTLEGRWLSPKLLVGESYGTTRAAALADYLDRTFGIRLNGLVLISPALDYATLALDGSLNLPYALYLPSLAAAKIFHEHGSPPRWEEILEPVERFALADYLTALHQGDRLPPHDRQALVDEVSSATGLSPQLVARNDLRIPFRDFAKQLLSDRERIVGRMDASITGTDPDPGRPYAYFDPSLDPLFGPFSSTINHYIRLELGYRQNTPFEFLNDKVSKSWDWSSAVHGGRKGQGYVNAADDLAAAMTKNPHLKVLVAGGLFDLATPYYATEHTLSQMGLDGELKANLAVRRYRAGHMIYLKKAARRELYEDVASFYEVAVPKEDDHM